MSNQIQTMIQVELEDRNRLTVFFRQLLALPALIYVASYFSSAFWMYFPLPFIPVLFALVFRGVYPTYALTFSRSLLSLVTRLSAYILLLTDDYPSIEENSIVTVSFPEVGDGSKLSRWLPLIKLFLAIPHYIMAIIYAIFCNILIIFAFFSILFSGKYPVWCADATVGILAYFNRVIGYAFLLVTDEYPSFSL